MAAADRTSKGSVPVVRREVAGHGFRVREMTYRPDLRQDAHAHEHDGITLVLSGGIRETVGRHEEAASCLSVVVKPAGVVHADRVGPRGARTLQVLLDPGRSLAPGKRGLGPWRWTHAGGGIRALLAIQRALAGPPRTPSVEDLVLAALGEMADEAPPASIDPPDWLRRAREALDDGSPEAASVRGLAAQVGVHPVSLTRAFRRRYGVSVTAYRRRIRIRQAAHAIEQTDRELTRIAHAVGFSDHPHMCRELRAATGLTPGNLRKLARRA